jgi:hypothetical protein
MRQPGNVSTILAATTMRPSRRLAFSPDGLTLARGTGGQVARPRTPEVAAEREAVGFLDFLFAKPLRKSDVIDYLQNSRTVRPQVRQIWA